MVSSWFCGRSISYDFCTSESGDCTGENGVSGAGYIQTSQCGLNDKINRAVVRYYDPSDKGAVTAFRDANCVNDSGRFDATTNADATVPM